MDSDGDEMQSKLCRQLSIESPGALFRDCVFQFTIPIPDTPSHGARIKVVCAGACYRPNRSTSVTSVSSITSSLDNMAIVGGGGSVSKANPSPAHHGIRNGSLFPGFEVAGVIDQLGTDHNTTITSNGQTNNQFYIGQRIVLYPFDDLPNGYSDYIVVPDMKYLIPIPDTLPLSVAAMLPTGALLAMNTVFTAHQIIHNGFNNSNNENRSDDKCCKILIVGTGGLALWAVRIAAYKFAELSNRGKVQITVASLQDDGFFLAKEIEEVNVVQWSEDLYEEHLIERTKDACGGNVNIVIDFGTTSRSLHRSMQCLEKGGVVLISEDTAEKLLPRFSKRAEESDQQIQAVANGTIDQLRHLVELVATNAIQPPPHSVFPCEDALEVVRKLCLSEIVGRAILRFEDID